MEAFAQHSAVTAEERARLRTSGVRSYRPIVQDALTALGPRQAAWQIGDDTDASAWIRLRHREAILPAQGWKLHVSAGLGSAAHVLARVLPVLLDEVVSFKLAASAAVLTRLNEGDAGLSQIGKFITVYPHDDAQAVRLGRALDAATRGMRGPAILSDRPVVPGSLVHYRYGAFADRFIRTPVGETLPAIVGPEGQLIPDRRLARYRPPDWVRDPFGSHPAAADTTPQLLAGRFLLIAPWHHSPRGTVHLAVDIVQGCRCVVKSARRDSLLGFDGRDARTGLRHEAALLARVAPDPRFPAVLDLVAGDDGDLHLVLEDLEGEPLSDVLGKQVRYGRTVPQGRVVSWGRELATILGHLHAHGIVYRDLKAPNIIVAPDGSLRLVDFGTAHELASPERPFGLGTRGYMSPQQAAGAAPAIADDVYGLGAILFLLATGAQPEMAPNTAQLLDRPLDVLNLAMIPELAHLIRRCLDSEPARRYPTMAALDAALAAIATEGSPTPPPYGNSSLVVGGPERGARRRAATLARRLGDTLCRTAHAAPDGPGRTWASRDALTAGLFGRDVTSGAAGAILALTALVETFGDPTHEATLREAAQWLRRTPSPTAPLPGLYVGEAGVGAALLRAGQVLGDDALIRDAAARGRWIATMPHTSPDLYNGTAGRLRFHLLLWDETGDEEHFRHAIAAGERLVATAAGEADAGLCWIMPAGYEGLSGEASLGYAHGAAGIADALLDLYEATGDRRFLEVVLGAARWLGPQALPTLDDGSGLDWPASATTPIGGPFWCHGGVGVGRFFLHLAALDTYDGAWPLVRGAARAAARGARWANPTQCHGLAGNIEFLLDVYQASGDRAHRTEARSLARLLEAFGADHGEGLVWPGESSERIVPDYMVGYAGVAVCLLRLADPDHRPHQLSRHGFRYHPAIPVDCD